MVRLKHLDDLARRVSALERALQILRGAGENRD
jgi:hypothetical protein